MGPKYLKLWEFNDDEKVLEPVEVKYIVRRDEDEQFLLCEQLSKLDDKDLFCVVTDLGDLLLFKNRNQLSRTKVELSQQDIQEAFSKIDNLLVKTQVQKKEAEYFPTALSHYTKGIILGFQYLNVLSIYEL